MRETNTRNEKQPSRGKDGPGHGLANVILNGLYSAGHKNDVHKLCVLKNFKKSPFNSSQWFRKLQGVGQELARTATDQDKFAWFAFKLKAWACGWTRRTASGRARTSPS